MQQAGAYEEITTANGIQRQYLLKIREENELRMDHSLPIARITHPSLSIEADQKSRRETNNSANRQQTSGPPQAARVLKGCRQGRRRIHVFRRYQTSQNEHHCDVQTRADSKRGHNPNGDVSTGVSAFLSAVCHRIESHVGEK
jgi:hypothetical protein